MKTLHAEKEFDGAASVVALGMFDGVHIGHQRLIRRAAELATADVPDNEAICQLGEGWVGDEAFAIAVFCALRYQDDLPECLIAAVTHDGDSDSTGAIAGNILGAWLGASAIPAEWLAVIETRDIVERMAVRIHEVM